jgi:hypothetical protein
MKLDARFWMLNQVVPIKIVVFLYACKSLRTAEHIFIKSSIGKFYAKLSSHFNLYFDKL